MTHPHALPLKTTEVLHDLLMVAQGKRPADLVIENARVVNVFTGEIHENFGVAVTGPWIARVSEGISDTIGPDTRVIDAAGRTLIPGFIDGHTHMAVMYTPEAFVPHAIASGVTTVITETLEFMPVAGIEGIRDFLEALKGQPIRFFATATPLVSIHRRLRGAEQEALSELLKREDILGIGESYWQAVLQDPEVYLPSIALAHRFNKLVEGHTAGAAGARLSAYAALGVTSCHEPINAGQALSVMRLGVHVLAREGSVRRDIDAIAPLAKMEVDLRRLALASDSVSPRDLLEGRYLAHAVQKAIRSGFPPVTAIQMATVNVAEHFRLDHLLGAVAPGRLADLVLIADPAAITPEMVLVGGSVVFDGGRCLVAGRPHAYSPKSRMSVRLPRDLSPDDFVVPAPDREGVHSVRVMKMVTDLVTAESEMKMAAVSGRFQAAPEKGLCKVAAVDRGFSPGKSFTGFIEGFGLSSGAMATSMAWDGADIVVVGCSEADMAHAVNRVKELQGGVVLWDRGKVAAEIPLPIFGLLGEGSLEEVAESFDAFCRAAAGLGVSFPDPVLSLNTLTCAAIPYLRICSEGLVNLKDGKSRSLIVS